MLADIARERGWAGSGRRRERVADLGTGSGVLAIAARMLGSGPVDACDFDPFAVEVARRNVARHGLDGIEVAERDVLDWKPRRRYEVVVANLFSSVLIEALPVIAQAAGAGRGAGLLGDPAFQAWEVFEAAAARGIGFSKVVRRGKWVSARGGWMADLGRELIRRAISLAPRAVSGHNGAPSGRIGAPSAHVESPPGWVATNHKRAHGKHLIPD